MRGMKGNLPLRRWILSLSQQLRQQRFLMSYRMGDLAGTGSIVEW